MAKPAPARAPTAFPASRAPLPGALPARFRFRHFVVAASFVLAVLLPLAASVWYLYARAADQYHSETAFSVRSEEVGASAAAGLLGALTQVGSGSASDTDILFDFIRSQEIVQAIDARLDLRAMYNRAAPRDFVFTLGDDPSIEALLAHWHRMVQVDLESHAGIIHVRANAFTPEDATAIAGADPRREQRPGEPPVGAGARGRGALRAGRAGRGRGQPARPARPARRVPPRQPPGRPDRRRRRPDGAARARCRASSPRRWSSATSS